MLCLFVLAQYRRVTDRQTDRQTVRHAVPNTALNIAGRVYKCLMHDIYCNVQVIMSAAILAFSEK